MRAPSNTRLGSAVFAGLTGVNNKTYKPRYVTTSVAVARIACCASEEGCDNLREERDMCSQ